MYNQVNDAQQVFLEGGGGIGCILDFFGVKTWFWYLLSFSASTGPHNQYLLQYLLGR